jgi:hypothetical protein
MRSASWSFELAHPAKAQQEFGPVVFSTVHQFQCGVHDLVVGPVRGHAQTPQVPPQLIRRLVVHGSPPIPATLALWSAGRDDQDDANTAARCIKVILEFGRCLRDVPQWRLIGKTWKGQ